MKTSIIASLGIAAVLGVLYIPFARLMEMPVVYESWSTRDCVRVEDPSNQYSCTHMPEKYLHEWVK